jgi:hypothetical protein
MVAATTGGTMNIGVRRRLMALVAAIGVAMTMFVTAPLAPAHAASVVHATPATPAGTHTMDLYAKAPAATNGKNSPLSDPEVIRCHIEALAPEPGGGRANSLVTALATVDCTSLFDGSPVPVPFITLTNKLIHDGRTMNSKTEVVLNQPSHAVLTVSAPCADGDWTSVAEATINFSADYDPPSGSGSNTISKTFNFGDCPNDYVEVPDVTDLDVNIAKRLLDEAGLVGVVGPHGPSCDFPKFVIMDQSPKGGQLVLLESTVVKLTQSDGRPRNGDLCN